MIALISLLAVLVVSLMCVRIATVALTLTGLSRDLARFQARSAFSGSGFTTAESEKVVKHPVRRRIIMILMLLGNAGIVTAVSSLILSFTNVDEASGITGSLWFRLALLILFLTALWFVAYSQWIDRRLSRMITWALKRWTSLDARDYAGLLHLTGDYSVAELQVQDDDWLANRKLAELRLNTEGILVLGVERANGKYIGAPRGQTELHPGDTLLIYGRGKVLDRLDKRRAGPEGNREHVETIVEQSKVEREESEDDGASENTTAAEEPDAHEVAQARE